MRKNHFLPIDRPDFICRDQVSCANAVVKAVAGEQFRLLMCAKYINCFFEKEALHHKLVISTFDQWCAAQKLMQLQLIKLLKETFQKEKRDLALTVKKCLLCDAYVFVECNRAYFEKDVDPDGQTFHAVVVGFDDDTNAFTVYGVDRSEHFSCYQITYQNFVKALFDTPNLYVTLNMWRHNKDVTISLDLPNIIFELEDYINSTARKIILSEDRIYGLDAMRELSRHFYETAKADSTVNEAYLHKFSMHKSYMKDRIEYLASSGFIDKAWTQQAEQVFQKGKDVFELGRVFNRSHDRSLIEKLAQTMDAAIALEANYLPKVLEELKKQN